MKKLFTILFSISILFPAIAANDSLTDEQLLQIKFDQKLNSQVSPDLVFRDETGKKVRLGDYFGKRPIVLMLGYYKCPMLCTLTLDGATESFRDLKWSAGKNFDVIFVSIDPSETPKLAAEKKKTYLRDYGRPGSENSWHFLTGDKVPIQTLANEIGFHFAYDAGLKEFVHPSGFVVLTPEGKTAHYFYGITFSPKEVDTALRDADVKKIDSPVQELILLCCEYSPLRGKYGYLVMDIIRVGGIGMVLAMGFYFFRSARKPVHRSGTKIENQFASAETNRR
jgi:protein SCO1/2